MIYRLSWLRSDPVEKKKSSDMVNYFASILDVYLCARASETIDENLNPMSETTI